MIVTLSSQQMLQTWRDCAGLEPLSADCSIERFDGIDINSRLTRLMRQWYLALLDAAVPEFVGPPVDATALVSIAPPDDRSTAVVTCDPSVRRLVSIRLSGWQCEAAVCPCDCDPVLLANRFARPGVCSPCAWCLPSSSVRVSPAVADSRIVAASAVIDPGPDVYRLDERALSTIDSSLILKALTL